MTDLIEFEAKDRLHLLAPLYVFQEDRITDWEDSHARTSRGDFGWVLTNFVQGGPGDASSANRNGNVFVDTELRERHLLIPRTPVNILHQRQNIIGTWVDSQFVDPKAAHDKALPADKMPFPYVQALGAIWKYHFPETWKMLLSAYDQGACWASMEAVAESLTCLSPRCCDSTTYPYRGLRDDSYCSSLNQPRALKRLNAPHFVGGALVVPPAMPAWRRADVTKMAATLEAHPEEAELVYEQIAASAEHLEPAEWEFLMSVVIAGAFGDDDTKIELTQADVDRIFSCLIPDITFDAPAKRQLAKDAAEAEAAAGKLVAAGLFVVAKDTGRLLMLQRAVDPKDPASGMWEAPGGHIDPGETALDAAKREWSEELGCELPDGLIVGTWTSPNGIYQGFVHLVSEEGEVKCNMDPEKRDVLNPDDPDSDNAEIAAWWDPKTLPGMPALRVECESTDWDQINNAPDSTGISKDDANYRSGNVGEPACSTCGYFNAMDSTCELVAGEIDPTWLSDLYTPFPEGREVKPLKSGVERVHQEA